MMYNKNVWFSDGPRHMNDMHFGRGGADFFDFGPTALLSFSLITVLFVIALVWTIVVKGYALWTAAKRNEKWWFVALLVINTFGILELAYLIFVARKFDKVRDAKEAKEGDSKHKAEHGHYASHDAGKSEAESGSGQK